MEIIKGKHNKPWRLVVYGQPGIGKSSLAASIPGALVLDTEDGTGLLECDRVHVTSYTQLVDALVELQQCHEYGTVVIDTADAAELFIHKWITDLEGGRPMAQCCGGYGKAYELSFNKWRNVLHLCDTLREGGKNIGIVAHSRLERVEDPEQESYDRYTLNLQKLIPPLLFQWCDAMLFAMASKVVVTGDDGKRKAKGQGERLLRTCETPACQAKNRYGMPPELPLKWEEVAKYLNNN